jgi:hypothetical protein
MLRRGPKPKGKVKIEWSADFAYAIGLIVTDGCLARYKGMITFTSKDIEQIENFLRCLKITAKIIRHHSGTTTNLAYRVQIGDVLFHEFLKSIGITPAKSLTIKEVKIPDEHFFDFLRGAFDGDGCTHSYWDPRWKSSFMFYTIFASASKDYLLWLQAEISMRLGITGHITKAKTQKCMQLKYAKADSVKLLNIMYYSPEVTHLSRKKLKIDQMLAIVGQFI